MSTGHGAALAPALALVVNAFVWGVSWWPFRYLEARGLHPLWATASIYLVSLGVLLLARPKAGLGFRRHPLLWLLMIAAGFTNVGFNWAVTMGDVVRVVLLFYLMPAWTVLLAWPMLGERPTAIGLARIALAMTGVVIVLKAPGSAWARARERGHWLAIGGGLSFALTNILLRKMSDVPAPARILAMFSGGAICASAAGLVVMSLGLIAAPPQLRGDWALVAFGLSLGFLASNIALQYGASRVSAHTAALIMLSEVVFAAVSSVLLGAAEMNARTWIGGLLILAAAAWSALSPGQPKPH